MARPLRLEDEGAFYHIETTDYHAGREALSRADIIELLEVIDGKAGEKEQDLMADLEQDEDDF